MAVFYPFSDQIPLWQVLGACFSDYLISAVCYCNGYKRIAVSLCRMVVVRDNYSPVIGIIQVGNQAMADRYLICRLSALHYAGLGIPLLIKNENIRKKILFPVAITFLTIMSFLTWKQCGYWKNSIELSKHTLQVTKNNFRRTSTFASALVDEGKIEEAIYHYNEAIRIMPNLCIEL